MKAGGVPKYSDPPPANTEPGYQACLSVGCVGGLGDLVVLLTSNPTQRVGDIVRTRNYAGPQHFCH